MLDPESDTPVPAPVLDAEAIAARRAARPDAAPTIVLLDGTWAQCSRMSRRVPELAGMQAFALPPGRDGSAGGWRRLVDTSLAPPDDVSERGAAPRVTTTAYPLGPHAVAMLVSSLSE